MMTHTDYMKLALQLAASARGNTNPNPLVGAVIVKDGVIVGTGMHRKAGEPHAEVYAFNMAGEQAKGATLYVTLEPCSHYGKTPPCALRVKESGVSRVFVAMQDPNPSVAGRGIQLLRDAGIEVEVGLLEDEARLLNERFIHNMLTNRPFIRTKYAMTLDGKIATHTGDSKWITADAAREDVHRIRHEVDGILVGIQTVLADNPSLTTRLPENYGKNPTRIIFDTQLRTPLDANVCNDEAPTIFVVGSDVTEAQKAPFEALGKTIITAGTTLEETLETLHTHGITDILVEGGGAIHSSFIRAQLVNQYIIYVAPKIIGGAHALSPVTGADVDFMREAVDVKFSSFEAIGDDLKIIAYPKGDH